MNSDTPERLIPSLELERAQLAAIFEHAPAFLAVLRGPEHVFERVNPAYMQLVGHRNLIGLTVLEALPEIRGQGFVELLDHVLTTGEPFTARQLPVVLTRSAGAPPEKRFLDVVYQRLQDGDAEYALVAHGVDVTDQVLATERLQRSERHYRDAQLAAQQLAAIVNSSTDAIISADMNGVVATWNEAAARLFGYSSVEIIGQPLSLWSPNAETERLATVAAMQRGERIEEKEGLRRRKDGSFVQVSLTIFALRSLDGEIIGTSAVVRDMTERMELEAKLRQSHKMEAVGRLAGGVAHDFNNLLTVIGAHSAFLLESLDPSDPQYEDAEAIQKAAIRAGGLTRQLLAFSRKQILKPASLALNAIIEETRKMLQRLLGAGIEIGIDLAGDLGRVVADPTQIEQVLMNLALNARDAMPDGGRLTITTRNVTITANTPATRHVLPPGEYALIRVRDTGIGMDEATQARLFEPFFTTKPAGKGTGLGLATVYGIVQQSAGFIFSESTPGLGTTFDVYLPLLPPADEESELRVGERAMIRGEETVLIVEDEGALREIVKRVLRRQGYVVLEAANGSEALAVSAAYSSIIHLVVTDVVMPVMGGAEVARRLQEQRPDLKVLFMSGHTDDDVVRRGIVSSTMLFLQKPFEPGDLARAVRDALDA